MAKKKICFIASTGIPVFHGNKINKLAEDFDVYAVMNFTDPSVFEGIHVVEAKSISIERRPSLLKDLRSLWQLYRYFRRNKFDAFISNAPKSSLLASIAGKMAGTPVRIIIFTGQIWANMTGFKRKFYKTIDRITVALNTNILVDGKPQRKYLISEGILKEGQAEVLANGSIGGVDTELFKPDAEVRTELRRKYKIEINDIVFSFLGRITRDKGIFELLSAFNELAPRYANIKLLLIGNLEGITEEMMTAYPNLKMGENLIVYGPTKEPYRTLQMSDIFCLPSYREGFGVSAIEAASLSLPVICSDAYGLADAFVKGETGLECRKMDVESLRQAMETYIQHPEILKEFGDYGRFRIVKYFNKELVSQAWSDYMKALVYGEK